MIRRYIDSTYTATTHLPQFETVVWAIVAHNHAYIGCWSKDVLDVGLSMYCKVLLTLKIAEKRHGETIDLGTLKVGSVRFHPTSRDKMGKKRDKGENVK